MVPAAALRGLALAGRLAARSSAFIWAEGGGGHDAFAADLEGLREAWRL